MSVFVKHIKNRVFRGSMWNVINSSGISKLANLIDKVLPISNVIFTDLAIVLSS